MAELAPALRQLRRRFRLSQAQLALKLGVSTITLSRWERGVQQIRSPLMLTAALHQIEQDLLAERRARGPGRPPGRYRPPPP